LGQSLELIFLSPRRIERTTIREKLLELGLSLKEARGSLDWMTWDPKGRSIQADATAYHGIWDMYFVRLGFDSKLLRDKNVNESKDLINEFLALGQQIWNAFSFYEGELSPEEVGSLLYGLRGQVATVREILPANNYARFLSQDAATFAGIQNWALKDHPRASIRPLPDGGVLVIWDDSREGLARFLSNEFSI
jgi:hypothetical protein